MRDEWIDVKRVILLGMLLLCGCARKPKPAVVYLKDGATDIWLIDCRTGWHPDYDHDRFDDRDTNWSRELFAAEAESMHCRPEFPRERKERENNHPRPEWGQRHQWEFRYTPAPDKVYDSLGEIRKDSVRQPLPAPPKETR